MNKPHKKLDAWATAVDLAQLELARRLEYLAQIEWEALNELLERVDRMLSGLIRHLKAKH